MYNSNNILRNLLCVGDSLTFALCSGVATIYNADAFPYFKNNRIIMTLLEHAANFRAYSYFWTSLTINFNPAILK